MQLSILSLRYPSPPSRHKERWSFAIAKRHHYAPSSTWSITSTSLQSPRLAVFPTHALLARIAPYFVCAIDAFYQALHRRAASRIRHSERLESPGS